MITALRLCVRANTSRVAYRRIRVPKFALLVVGMILGIIAALTIVLT